MSIEWEDPPSVGQGRPIGTGKWKALAAELREHPGKWALAGTYSYHNTEGLTKLKNLGCEATSRKISLGEYRLYARWPEEAS